MQIFIKILFKKTSFFIALFLAMSLLFLLLLTTPEGTQLAWMQLKKQLPKTISLGTISGNLLSDIKIKNIKIQQEHNFISIDHIKIHWEPLHLLQANIRINHLIVDGVTINWHSKKPANPKDFLKFYKKYLSYFIFILEKGAVNKLAIIDESGNKHRINRIELTHADLAEFTLSLPIWTLTTPNLAITSNTYIHLNNKYSLNNKSEIFIPLPQVPPLHLTTFIQGDLARLIAYTHTRAPYTAQAELVLNDLLGEKKLLGQFTSKWITPQKIKTNWPNMPIKINGKISGTLKNPLLDINAKIKKTPWGNFTGKVHIPINSYPLKWHAQIPLLDGHIKGQGKISWKSQWNMNGKITGSNLNSAHLFTQWPSKINVSTQFNLQQKNKNSLQVRLNDFNLTGFLKKIPIHLNSQLSYHNQLLSIPRLDINYGSSQITAKGKIGKLSQFSMQLDAKNIQQWLPKASGNVKVKAQFFGTWKKPTIHANFFAENIQLHDFFAQSLKGNFTLNAKAKNPLLTSLEVTSGHLNNYPIDHAVVTARGSIPHHNFTLALTSPHLISQGNGQGYWKNNQWHFTLQEAKIQPDPLPPWILSAPAEGFISATEQSFSPHCWYWVDSRVCAEFMHSSTKIHSEFSLNKLPLNYFMSLFPENVQPLGMLSASIHTTTQGVTGTFLLDLPQEGITFAQVDLPELLSDWPNWQHTKIQGNARSELRQLAFLSEWLPRVEILDGQWQSNFALSGTWNAPQFAGQGMLENGHILLAGPEIELTQVTATFNDIQQGILSSTITARSGKGALSLTGQVNFESEIPHIIGIFNGDRATLMNTKEFQIIASPNLNFDLTPHQLLMEGIINIPQAQLSLKNFSDEQGIAPSTDQTIIQTENNKRAETNRLTISKKPKFSINSDINLVLGDKVFFEGFGLKSRLFGSIHIIEKDKEKALASGQIEIKEGRYRGAYGQDLEIQQGRLLFAGGPVDQPGIDLQAVRKIDDSIQVGINARGNLANPVFSLFSTPVLSQSEQLSYLVLGTKLENSSQGENQTLFNAALSLGLEQSGHIAQNLGARAGIDEISIETIDTSETTTGDISQQAALSIGKYLSPKLYISYGIGLFDPVSTVKLRYRIDRHWRFHTESNAKSTSGDLIYEIERGK